MIVLPCDNITSDKNPEDADDSIILRQRKIMKDYANVYFSNLRKEIVAWEGVNFPNTPAYRNLLGMGEELGELFHAHLKGEQRIRQDDSLTKEKKADALGDLLVYAVNYANKENLCLLECLEKAWAEVKQRDWIKYPKNGRSE